MKQKRTILVVLMIFFLMSCTTIATLQQQWNKLTPNEKARIVVGGFQDQLNTLFDIGKAYVDKNPDKLPVWKSQVVPAFDTANKALKGYIILIGAGTATPEMLYKEIPPVIKSVISLLTNMGVKL